MYNLCNYWDVWGNKEDGYEINEWSYPEGINFTYKVEQAGDEQNDQDIVNQLISDGYLKDHVVLSDLEIVDECNGLIMIYAAKSREPLFCLEYKF